MLQYWSNSTASYCKDATSYSKVHFNLLQGREPDLGRSCASAVQRRGAFGVVPRGRGKDGRISGEDGGGLRNHERDERETRNVPEKNSSISGESSPESHLTDGEGKFPGMNLQRQFLLIEIYPFLQM